VKSGGLQDEQTIRAVLSYSSTSNYLFIRDLYLKSVGVAW
jgi:hypothetical protein